MQQNEKINLSVGLEGRSYPILIGSNLVHDIEKCLNEVTQSGNKAILVFDEGFHNVINQFGWEFVNNFPSLVYQVEKPQSQLNIYPNFGLFLVNNVLIERVQFSL